jgi:hypothetical protein
MDRPLAGGLIDTSEKAMELLSETSDEVLHEIVENLRLAPWRNNETEVSFDEFMDLYGPIILLKGMSIGFYAPLWSRSFFKVANTSQSSREQVEDFVLNHPVEISH